MNDLQSVEFEVSAKPMSMQGIIRFNINEGENQLVYRLDNLEDAMKSVFKEEWQKSQSFIDIMNLYPNTNEVKLFALLTQCLMQFSKALIAKGITDMFAGMIDNSQPNDNIIPPNNDRFNRG
jgi:hypothetical protein